MNRLKNNLLKILYAILFLFALWYLISLLVNRPIIPYPHIVFFDLLKGNNSLFFNLNYSIFRIFFGIFFAILIGYPIGLFMGFYKKIDKIFSPIIYLTYPIPKIALLPIVMLLFGLGDLPKIIMIVLIIIFQIILATRDGVKEIDSEVYHTFYSLGANNVQIFSNIIIPATLPKVLTSLRIAVGTSISVLFFTETFGTEHGMGFYIVDAWMRFNYVEMYGGIMILSLLGLFIFFFLDILQWVLCPWNRQ
ncbi:MAG: ABC transporter permease [Thermotogota bacterium]